MDWYYSSPGLRTEIPVLHIEVMVKTLLHKLEINSSFRVTRLLLAPFRTSHSQTLSPPNA